ncbi:MAG: hypothetical protein JKY54_08940 [Flavobacteriales bacterium]|nr:hypothetical protein [Flavobacteriales bacterium]
MRLLYSMLLLMASSLVFGQSLQLKNGLEKCTIKKGMYLDFQFDASDSIVKRWTSLKNLNDDHSLSSQLWKVDSISELCIFLNKITSWKHDTLATSEFRYRSIKQLVKQGAVNNGYLYTDSSAFYLLSTPISYDSKTLNMDSIYSLRLCQTQGVKHAAQWAYLKLLSSIGCIGAYNNGAFDHVKKKWLIPALCLLNMVVTVQSANDEEVKTYILRNWNIKISKR